MNEVIEAVLDDPAVQDAFAVVMSKGRWTKDKQCEKLRESLLEALYKRWMDDPEEASMSNDFTYDDLVKQGKYDIPRDKLADMDWLSGNFRREIIETGTPDPAFYIPKDWAKRAERIRQTNHSLEEGLPEAELPSWVKRYNQLVGPEGKVDLEEVPPGNALSPRKTRQSKLNPM